MGTEEEPMRSESAEGEQTSMLPEQEEMLSTVELREPLASARQLSYLFIKDPSHLEAKDQQMLAFLQQEKEIELASRLSQQLLFNCDELICSSSLPFHHRQWIRQEECTTSDRPMLS